jgi:hypothetical protein
MPTREPLAVPLPPRSSVGGLGRPSDRSRSRSRPGSGSGEMAVSRSPSGPEPPAAATETAAEFRRKVHVIIKVLSSYEHDLWAGDVLTGALC